ncbi:uncharacterized protein FFE2_08603 [Fusarium fujikuroi]|uniref:Uncharacterized protein n=1 Tax=Fusarium fujikuroi TaxID=5127 RepID=A0A9Q9UEZ3_FUSFU|nr:uncharacterized protein FFE2_08603 [Fusarium fujikuroi]VTT74608.1 unnamed protein product [Fusarium fujikuroi]
MAPFKPTHSGRGNSDRGGARRGRPNHGVEKAAPTIPAPDQEGFKAAVQAEVARQLAGFSVNVGDSNMTGVEGSDPQPGLPRGGARSTRRGYTGRNGRGGSHLGRSRAYRNNQTSHRPGTASSNMEPRFLPSATASEMIWVADRQGNKAAKIVNHTPLSDNTDAFAQKRPYNQCWGITPGYGLNEEAKDLLNKAGPGYTRVMYQLVAVSEEHFNAVSQNAVEKTIEDHNGKNVEGKNALLLRAGVDPHPEREDEEEEEEQEHKVCDSPDVKIKTEMWT